MAVVVEQTVPFSSASLDLHQPARWTSLLPLIRPSMSLARQSTGQEILFDAALASKSDVVHIITVIKAGNFSSKVLDDQHVAAIVVDAGQTRARELQQIFLSVSQAAKEPGVVVVRQGKQSKVDVHSSTLIEVTAKGELEVNHIVHLLGNTTEACRKSIQHTTELLELFNSSASTAHSRFHTEKVGGHPSIAHGEGTHEYEKARHAVERDLKYAMGSHTARTGEDVVYAVHYSDINGLSRLENYIVVGEIAKLLSKSSLEPPRNERYADERIEAQGLSYHLSHSTVLDHGKPARGFSISICPIPSRYLSAQQQPKPHQVAPRPSTSTASAEHTQSSAKMTFDDPTIRKRIEAGCNALIKQEPLITEYDTIVGDGDCGYTLRDGAQQVLKFVASADLSALPSTLAELVRDLEVNMGGTSGALYCIFLTALAASLASSSSIAEALEKALAELCKYTRARLGDRTMMDALIPFIDSLKASGNDAGSAVEAARKGVDGTKKMEASLGRSAYLDESATRGVPDPGAYGLLVLLEGMAMGS